MEAQSYIGRLIEVSNKKYRVLEDMLQTYLLQDESLAEGTVERQDELIEQRNQKMEEVDRLDEEFHVYTERLKTTLGIQALDELARFQFAGRVELKEVILRITRLLEELADRHRKVEHRLKDSLHAAGEPVRQIGKAMQMNQAYRPSGAMAPSSVFFDKKK